MAMPYECAQIAIACELVMHACGKSQRLAPWCSKSVLQSHAHTSLCSGLGHGVVRLPPMMRTGKPCMHAQRGACTQKGMMTYGPCCTLLSSDPVHGQSTMTASAW